MQPDTYTGGQVSSQGCREGETRQGDIQASKGDRAGRHRGSRKVAGGMEADREGGRQTDRGALVVDSVWKEGKLCYSCKIYKRHLK